MVLPGGARGAGGAGAGSGYRGGAFSFRAPNRRQ